MNNQLTLTYRVEWQGEGGYEDIPPYRDSRSALAWITACQRSKKVPARVVTIFSDGRPPARGAWIQPVRVAA